MIAFRTLYHAATILAYMLYVGILSQGVYRMLPRSAWFDRFMLGVLPLAWLLGTASRPSAERLISLGCMIATVLIVHWRDRRDARHVEQGEPPNPFTTS